MAISIVYEDEWILAVNKPAGMLVIPSPRNERNTLTNILNEGLKRQSKPYRLHPCHRLDRETSGLIIYAKGKSTQKKMMDEFRQRRVKKTYIAFVQGSLKKEQAEIRNPIEGQSALTSYRVIHKKSNFTVVQVSPVTGRTNQIRIHFRQIGHPIVGEAKYAFRKDFKLKAKRLCLHAEALEFIHPVTKKLISLKSEPPEYLKKFLDEN